MQFKAMDAEYINWLSTYGLVTVERVIKSFGLDIPFEDITTILRDENHVFYNLLRVPLSSILTKIIIDQVEAYREFIQKLFIDYLLSGAGNDTSEPAPGGSVLESLEEDRKLVIATGDEFDLQVFNYHSLVAESQKELLSFIRGNLDDNYQISTENTQELINLNDKYLTQIDELQKNIIEYHKKFADFIVTIQKSLHVLPNYKPDHDKLLEHRAEIQFKLPIN